MGLLSWIIFGALAGWIASIIAGTNRRQGCIANIVIGIVGAFVGGLLVGLATGDGFDLAFDLGSLVVAVMGALILLAIFPPSRRGRGRRGRRRR
jgi:uncharacterized membrane protein YeaQ/YmgE (transglycosylase-associated protein family)